MEATREQQREARRQKVLARSQSGGHRAQVVDLATNQQIAPQGASAVLDDEGHAVDSSGDGQATIDGLLEPGSSAAAVPAADASKSASRLAAERRRQRILSRSTERMAKVQGDRVMRGGGEEDTAGGEGGGESLDDMLQAAEAEFFGGDGSPGAGSVAEAKPGPPHQAYFKSAQGGRGGDGGSGGGGDRSNMDSAREGSSAARGEAQSKPGARQRRGTGGVGFKPSLSEGGTLKRSSSSGRGVTSSHRPGNRALDRKAFDLASVQSLSQAGGGGKKATAPGRKRLLGGARFWAGLEGVTKTALLLLVGAGVGGLLLPEARAAVAQAKFEADNVRGFMDPRSRLEMFFARDAKGGEAGSRTSLDVDLGDADAKTTNEFGDQVDSVDAGASQSSEATGLSESETESEDGAVTGGDREGGSEGALTWEELGDITEGADGSLISRATEWFLSSIDLVVSWVHYFSAGSMPWASGSEISCVSAIYLALLVRLVVAMVFSTVRFALALPVSPPAAPSSKPGMIMGMILASVPTLGKVLAWGGVVKSIFADTNLVVAGTVLTLAVRLALEEGAGPRRFAEDVAGALGLFGLQGPDNPTLEEL